MRGQVRIRSVPRAFGGLFAALLVLAWSGASTANSDISGAAKGVAIEGYDPVAYYTDGKPVKGTPEFSTEWSGTRWQFASAGHRDRFVAAPEKYAPQYGGYCAYAASINIAAPGDPDRWKIVGDRLYLNNNLVVHKLWQQDIPGRVSAGDQHWAALKTRIEAGEK